MPIRTLPSRAIADASIQAVDIANSSISKVKIDADTRLGLQNDSIILDGTDGAGANKGDFLVLNGTDGSSTNADDRILFDETFIDKIGLFNINTLGSGGQAVKVNSGGTGLEFGAAGGLVLLNTQSVTSSVSTVDFVNGTNGVVLDSTYKRYRFICSNMRASSAANFGIRFRQGGSFISTNVYRMKARCLDDNNAEHNASNSTGMNYMRLFARSISNDAVETSMIDFTLNDLSNTSSYTSVFGTGGGNKGNGRAEIEMFAGMITNTTTVDGVQFVLSSGTFEQGDFSLYGIDA